jgi:hypothetical protein
LFLAIVVLLAVLIAAVAWLAQRIERIERRQVDTPAVSRESIELLVGRPGAWLHHSMRPEGHKDIAEALDTPGMAIRRGDAIEEGRQ